MSNNQAYKKSSVFLLPPNLICYVRLITLLLSLYMLNETQHPVFWIAVLGLSDILDAFDGHLARKFKLSSHLGHILDFTCDRLTLSGMMLLSALYFPDYWFLFLLAILLDISSHYTHLKATYLQGSHNHKDISSMPKILRYYYGSRGGLFCFCFMHDVCMFTFIAYHYFPHSLIVKLLFIITAPWFLFKTVIHVMQLLYSLQSIVAKDVHEKNSQIQGSL